MMRLLETLRTIQETKVIVAYDLLCHAELMVGDNLASSPSAGAIRHNKKKGISNIIRYDRTEDIIRVLATWTASNNQNHEQTEPETLLDNWIPVQSSIGQTKTEEQRFTGQLQDLVPARSNDF